MGSPGGGSSYGNGIVDCRVFLPRPPIVLENVMRRIAVAAFALTVMAACQPATTEMTEAGKTEIEEQIRIAYADFDEAYQTDDFDRWRSHLTDDVRWGGGGSFVGTEQLVRFARAHMSRETEFSGETDDIHVRVLGPNAVLLTAAFHGTTVEVSGESNSERTAMTTIWIKVDGVWKIVHGHTGNQPM